MKMQVLKREDYLGDNEASSAFVELFLDDDQLSEVAVRAIVQCHVEVQRSLEGVVQFDDEGEVYLLEDVGFTDCVLELLLADQLLLVEDLHR